MNYIAYLVIVIMVIHAVHQVVGLFNAEIYRQANASATITKLIIKVMSLAGPDIVMQYREAIIIIKFMVAGTVLVHFAALIIGLIFAPEVNKLMWTLTCVVPLGVNMHFMHMLLNEFRSMLKKHENK